MVRIGEKEIPKNKNIRAALSYIYGFGKKFGPQSPSRKLLEKSNIDPLTKIRDLTFEQINLIRQEIKDFKTEKELKQEKDKIIDSQVKLGTYRGLRRLKRLPVNGQHTRSNARTAKAGA